MSYQISDAVNRLIGVKMATGKYATEDQLLLRALASLDEYEQSVADIRDGIEDEQAGRLRLLSEVDAQVRHDLGFTG